MNTLIRRSPEADHPLPEQERIPAQVAHKSGYTLRFARTLADLESVHRLRFQVFNLELGEGLDSAYATGLDQDEFDDQCQHLLVTHDRTEEVVGTYRLQISDAAFEGNGFYSAGEFDLAGIPTDVLQDSIELGRACISKPHRNQAVLYLLWCGLATYLQHHGKHRFFGCSSLTSQDMSEGLRFYEQLRRAGQVHTQFQVLPLPGYACHADDWSGPEVPIPTLFGTYLRHGALVLGPPAIDREFGTIDFLTYVEVNQRHLRMFGPRR